MRFIIYIFYYINKTTMRAWQYLIYFLLHITVVIISLNNSKNKLKKSPTFFLLFFIFLYKMAGPFFAFFLMNKK